jgi:hypothetical protein
MLEMYSETYVNSPIFLSEPNQKFESFDNIKFHENLFSSYDTRKSLQTDMEKQVGFLLQLFIQNAPTIYHLRQQQQVQQVSDAEPYWPFAFDSKLVQRCCQATVLYPMTKHKLTR